MMEPTRFLSLLALFCLLGCHTRPATRTVALLDVSGSIYPDEVDREFADMQTLASNLQRGDQLILIPITGNARNDTRGHIVRLTAPIGRMPFDSDSVDFRKEAREQIERMKDWAKRNPDRRTDIFGTLAVAKPELQSEPNLRTKIIILSDFIEDDGTWNFSADRRLASESDAVTLARAAVKHDNQKHPGVPVCLERLRSRDRGALSASRLTAIDVFWDFYAAQQSEDQQPSAASRPPGRSVNLLHRKQLTP